LRIRTWRTRQTC